MAPNNKSKGAASEPGAGTPGALADIGADTSFTRQVIAQIATLQTEMCGVTDEVEKLSEMLDRRFDKLEASIDKRHDKTDGEMVALRLKAAKAEGVVLAAFIGIPVIVTIIVSALLFFFGENIKTSVRESVGIKPEASAPVEQ